MEELDRQLYALAYTVGAFLGDGNLHAYTAVKNGKRYPLQVVQFGTEDKDMLEVVQEEIEQEFGPKYAIFPIRLKSGSEFWRMNVYRRDIFDFLAVNTYNRAAIPQIYFSAPSVIKRQLICGLMDSDGHITSRTMPSIRWEVGFGNTNYALTAGVASLLRSLGVKVGKIGTYQKGEYRVMYRIHPNMRSFAEAGPFFQVRRKAKKLERCISYLSGSETIHAAPVTSGEDMVQPEVKA